MRLNDEKALTFNGENYIEWEMSTMFYLKSKKLWKVIQDDPLALSHSSEEYKLRMEKWEEIDSQALGVIGERVDPKFYEELRDDAPRQEKLGTP